MKKWLRFFRKLLFWIFFVLLFLTTTATVVLHIYEDEIKQFAIEEINKHLKTKLGVQRIELSLFHDFPRASLEFNNVLIKDAYETQKSEDTLFFAKRVFCTFNLLDMWKGEYRVKRISTHDAILNLKTNKQAEVNYNIFKKSNEESAETNFKFALELLRIDRLNFTYANLLTGQHYKIAVNNALVQGDFSQKEYEILAESELHVQKIRSNALTLISDKPAHLNLTLLVNTESKTYHFKQGDLLLAQMPFEITGIIDSTNIDLEITGKNIELAQLANNLSAGTMPEATKYKSTGVLNFQSTIFGPISNSDMPSVTASFDVVDGTLIEPENQLKIYDINLLGTYQNKQQNREELLSFKQFDLKLLNSFFSGKATIRDFDQPKITTQMAGNLDLSAFHKFFKFQGVERLAGNIKLDLDLIIQFLDPRYRKEKFEITHSKGSLFLNNVVYKNGSQPIVYEKIDGAVIVNNKDAAVKDLHIKTAKSNFILNGAINNLINYVSGLGSMGMIATLESNSIDLNEFIGESNNSKPTANPQKFELPENINLNIDVDIKNLNWDQHRFSTISGKFLYANRKATANNLKFKTLNGEIEGKVVLNNMPESANIIEADLNFSKINMKSLFTDWKNFDQQTITDKHISGLGSGKVDLLLVFNPYFSIIQEKIYALSSIEIDNGELNELETMKSVTDYMRSNKGLKLLLNKHIDKFEEKLLNLKFSRLSNVIEIKDRKIYIPKMKIMTNALDVDLWGWHDFDNNVEYHFSFRFRDLKSKPEYTEFGKIVDDGLGLVIYLTMYGNVDNELAFALDDQERKNAIKENIASEKQTVKSALKTEFGVFKKDSTVQKMQTENKKQVEFIFYEEDVEEGDTKKEKQNKNRTGKLIDKISNDATKKDTKIEFEEE